MKTVSIIRDRGQLTIPDSVRKLVSWITPQSVVTISVVKSDQILITPHQKQIDWDKIWEGIRRSRAVKGKNAISAIEILQKDRQSH
ncbi:hypothetical protein A2631_01510 [Candidatus Daviesbacteria bacterium RIFCSPHIGHO2_01_FULL_44_29]|uniref:SpoVT-AbrB domain-containing protein n=1 Tax=Candidatus Daviesbacteria bacterium RIFCSPHIGHO2_02_FULL_43_12 TaxID=1797776 RepID=A0A1F5KJV6_9BACT|nr:MAG: hypothetical protein A2631_01510 [Candidatus Daviesbacteria bacterium RIFCSPHIGHO2_01_FULL_44_29]OGE39070.1 MAG: hypothetical protein A3E86_00570 [Candidatus Daviesbacteria bacterium RIFCSPHIGHO2_12_FULL_47_45]OGE41085.1 MAG: hypothetical protein A3D25_00905 [Candidatus Daviesbacteria bacterium RIFCSPHIGHO2_02_FULL_43_12]OGE69284.1 MAG: hypothetical protein A3B55_02645 [Candidatus Daviesbacteria bacterium RIFCSPLOWO2_01_FULL_43_15]